MTANGTTNNDMEGNGASHKLADIDEETLNSGAEG